MLHLALDTSAHFVSVALLDRDQVILELDSRRDSPETVPPEGRKAGAGDAIAAGRPQSPSNPNNRKKVRKVFPPGASVLLAPMIQALVDRAQRPLKELGFISIATGPGLFTGLRVGVVTAKSLAYSLKIDLIGVNTLQAIAAQSVNFHADWMASEVPVSIRSVLNAQRQQLFCGHFRSDSDWVVTPVEPDVVLGRDQWLELLRPGDFVTGGGLKPIVGNVRADHPKVQIADETQWLGSASTVGQIGWRRHQSGQRDDLWTLKPLYFRPSAAEEVFAKGGR